MSSVAGCSAAEMTRWLEPFYPSPPPELVARLESYLALLLRWNERTNLTAVRDAKGMVERHFGESLFAARHVAPSYRTLLDLGSGAGFPGIPIALCRPDLRVTLAESQGKKAAFLRECCRTLRLDAEVWAKRIEEMPLSRQFDVVTLRAVDNSSLARSLARARVASGGMVMELRSCEATDPAQVPIPHSHRRCLVLTSTSTVPRGTE